MLKLKLALFVVKCFQTVFFALAAVGALLGSLGVNVWRNGRGWYHRFLNAFFTSIVFPLAVVSAGS